MINSIRENHGFLGELDALPIRGKKEPWGILVEPEPVASSNKGKMAFNHLDSVIPAENPKIKHIITQI